MRNSFNYKPKNIVHRYKHTGICENGLVPLQIIKEKTHVILYYVLYNFVDESVREIETNQKTDS